MMIHRISREDTDNLIQLSTGRASEKNVGMRSVLWIRAVIDVLVTAQRHSATTNIR